MKRGILLEGSARDGGGWIESEGRRYMFALSDAPGVNDDWIGCVVEFEAASPLTASAVRLAPEQEASDA